MNKSKKPKNFKTDLQFGKKQEQELLKIFPNLTLLEGTGADLIDTLGRKIELKSDTYDMQKTANFFIEYLGSIETGAVGGPWKALKDDCQFFIYSFTKNGIIYVFDTKDLLEQLRPIIATLRPIEVKNRNWTTIGYRVPRASLTPLFVMPGHEGHIVAENWLIPK